MAEDPPKPPPLPSGNRETPAPPPLPPETERIGEPPTQRQIDYIRKLGGHPGSVRTKAEASRLIDEIVEGPSNRQLGLLAFMGFPPEVRRWSRDRATREISRRMNPGVREVWEQVKKAHAREFGEDIPPMHGGEPALWARFDALRDAEAGRLRTSRSAKRIVKWVFIGFLIVIVYQCVAAQG